MRTVSFLLIFSLLCLPLFSEGDAREEQNDPVPYGADEFPPWLRDVRRGEIIFFGSLPFTLLLTTLGYQTVDYLNERSGLNPEEAVWGNLTEDDRKTVLVASLSSALVIALVDFFIGKIVDD